MNELSTAEERKLKRAFAANIVLAGLPGLALIAPRPVRDRLWGPLFSRRSDDSLVAGLIGSIWFAFGAVSLLGYRNPHAFAGVLPVQVLYKAVWTGTVALPRLLKGDNRPLPLMLAFVATLSPVASALPLRWLFGDTEFERLLSRRRPRERDIEMYA